MLNEVRNIREKQNKNDKTLQDIKERLTKIEVECQSLAPIRADLESVQTLAEANTYQIERLTVRADDAEDRERRNSLVSYVLDDECDESWAKSEERVIAFSREHLKLSIEARDIEACP